MHFYGFSVFLLWCSFSTRITFRHWFCPEELICREWGGGAPIFSEASGAALCVLVNLFGIFLVSLLLAATYWGNDMV